jgi:hypothetical protein
MRRAAPRRGATSRAEPPIEEIRVAVMRYFTNGLCIVIDLTDDDLRVLHEELFEKGGLVDIVEAHVPRIRTKVERRRRRKGLRVVKGGKHA